MAGTNAGKPKQWRKCNECDKITYTRSPRCSKWSPLKKKSVFCGTKRIVR